MLLPQEHTVMVRQTSKWGQLFLLSLVGLGATAFATAWFYRLDEVISVQRKTGTTSRWSGGKKPIEWPTQQTSSGEWRKVEKGQALIRFDVKEAEAEKRTLTRQLELEKSG